MENPDLFEIWCAATLYKVCFNFNFNFNFRTKPVVQWRLKLSQVSAMKVLNEG